MAQKRAKEVVQFFFNCLKDQDLKVSRIVIFGSQAKGAAAEESDIDIIIVSEDFKRKNIFKPVEQIYWPDKENLNWHRKKRFGTRT
jgi:uncharacterized protein